MCEQVFPECLERFRKPDVELCAIQSWERRCPGSVERFTNQHSGNVDPETCGRSATAYLGSLTLGFSSYWFRSRSVCHSPVGSHIWVWFCASGVPQADVKPRGDVSSRGDARTPQERALVLFNLFVRAIAGWREFTI